MMSNGTEERVNFTSWNNLLITTSNASPADKLGTLKDVPEGELARIMELPVKQVFIPQATALFEALEANCGLAGDIYAKWLVNNVDKLPELVHEERQAIKDVVGDNPRERYWAAIGAVVFAGAKIAQDLGLINMPLDHLKEWFISMFDRSRETLETHKTNPDSVIGDFLSKHTGKILVVKNGMASSLADPQRMPTQGVFARFEAEQKQIYIAKNAFRDYCTWRQITMQEVLTEAKEPDVDLQYVGPRKKRMLSNTGVPSSPTDTLVFDCSEDALGGLILPMENDSE